MILTKTFSETTAHNNKLHNTTS